MKVTIVFDKTRMVFDSVDTLTFEQFMEAVSSKLGLDLNSFDILLGDNVVWLDAASPLTNFGIISGDLLYVRLKTGQSDGARNSSTRDGVPNPTTRFSSSSVGIASQTTSKAADLEMREPPPPTTAASKPTIEIPADKELDAFLVSFIVNSMLREGFTVFEPKSINTPYQIRRMFSNTASRDVAVQMSLDVYRDVVRPAGIDRVTSVALTWMTLTHKSGRRHFRDTIYLYRDTPTFSELLYDLITQMRQSVLGPSNDFLRILSHVEVADIFRFLSPADMLSVESTCRYARNLCCSSTLIDETVWRLALRQRYGDLEVSKVAAAAKLKTSKPGRLLCTYREAYIRRRKRENIFSASHHYVQPPSSFVGGRPPPAATPAALPSYLPVGPSAPGLGQPDVSYPPDAPLMQPRQPTNPDINPLMPGFGHVVMPHQPHRPLHPNIDPHHPFAPDGINPQPGLPDMPLESITRPPNIFAKRQDPFGRGGRSGSFDGNFPGGGFIG